MTDPKTQNELTVRSLFEEVINSKAYDQISCYCAPDIVMHRPGNVITEGREAYRRHYQDVHTVFPDFEGSLTDIVADTDRVATRFTVTGTHKAEFMGVPPTGKTVQFSAQILFRLEKGTITEEFHQSDQRTLRKQLTGT